jgi:ParB-like chromosome segregation protein Spo0J
MKKLNLDVIRIDGDTQPREELDQEMVAEYAELMRDGVKFPPVVVFFDGSNYWLVDGFHRYFATKSNGFVSIECEVKEGTQRDAQLQSMTANSKQHGKPATAKDKRRSVLRMLKDSEWGEWSNQKIAEWIGVSKMTVGRLKISLGEEKKEEVKYINKHGQEATMKTGNLVGNKVKPAVTPPPPELEYDPTQDEIKELGHTIKALEEENIKLKDAIAIGSWDASDIEKKDAEETIADLREQIRIKDIEIASLRESRDSYQNQNAELMRINSTLKKKLAKFIE